MHCFFVQFPNSTHSTHNLLISHHVKVVISITHLSHTHSHSHFLRSHIYISATLCALVHISQFSVAGRRLHISSALPPLPPSSSSPLAPWPRNRSPLPSTTITTTIFFLFLKTFPQNRAPTTTVATAAVLSNTSNNEKRAESCTPLPEAKNRQKTASVQAKVMMRQSSDDDDGREKSD